MTNVAPLHARNEYVNMQHDLFTCDLFVSTCNILDPMYLACRHNHVACQLHVHLYQMSRQPNIATFFSKFSILKNVVLVLIFSDQLKWCNVH